MGLPEYAELHCVSNFSFLRGASHPKELINRAAKLGYQALALTDECSMAGIVKAYDANRELDEPLKLIIGSEFQLSDGPKVILLVTNHQAYGELCELISRGRQRACKGNYHIRKIDLANLTHCLALWVPGGELNETELIWLKKYFPKRCWIALTLLRVGGESAKLITLQAYAEKHDVPLVATGDVHMHCRGRRALQDVVTAIRMGCSVHNAGLNLFPNGERHLRSRQDLTKLYPLSTLLESCHIANRCHFHMSELRYRYPKELVPLGRTASEHLRILTEQGSHMRWPEGVPTSIGKQIEHELNLIEELGYEAFFLTVHDITHFAKNQNILYQGRGSAANSVVCYCLNITAVNPAKSCLLFERFISRERNEPPDIDVDFEHERREEIIQYVYQKYTRQRAALAATVITYRARSAIREVGKALGLGLDQVDRLAKSLIHWESHSVLHAQLHECGFDPASSSIRKLLHLVNELVGFPRHLSQHVGGFVISDQPLTQLVPVENAAMPNRTIIQWDKTDLETMKFLKVDCLALGMLSALHKCFDMLKKWCGQYHDIDSIFSSQTDNDAVYRMIQKADTIGVFQIESRAQMAMLPRLRPREYYDLVIEIAIVRPGPIQGKMVHPYLKRRNGEEPVDYFNGRLKDILQRTLGVPIFQEQVMQIVMAAAGFSPGQADQLRRSMASWGKNGNLEKFESEIISGMLNNGYDRSFAQRIYEQIKGFGSYGFPESHSASFALLAYVSSWFKCHHPAIFCCALLNSQPMGFYSASQLVQDAKRHQVMVHPIDVVCSEWDCGIEQGPQQQLELRLGLRLVKGLGKNVADRIMAQRAIQPFRNLQDLSQRCRLSRAQMNCLADADAFRSLVGDRYQARWAAAGVEHFPPLLAGSSIDEPTADLSAPTIAANVITDYQTTGLTLRQHPMSLLRDKLNRLRVRRSDIVNALANGTWVRSAGLVTMRQRPMTAGGVIFMTLEDEAGFVNVVLWKDLIERYRRAILQARLLVIDGVLECQDEVQHLIAKKVFPLPSILEQLNIKARNFC